MNSVDIKRDTDLIAAEINSIKDETRRKVICNSIEIGRRLVSAKELIEHGEWGTWLKEKVNYSKSTANNLMKIFQEYGADQITLIGDNTKNEHFAKLSYSQAVELFGVPADEREKFVEENKVEEMSARELKKAIAEKKKVEEDYKRAIENNKAILEKNEALDNELKDIKEKLEVSENNEQNNEEIEKLKAIVEEKEDKLKTVEEEYQEKIKELENRPIEVAVSEEDRLENERLKKEIDQIKREKDEAIAKVEEEKQREIQRLEEENAKSKETGPDEDEIKFKVVFDTLTNDFKKILESLALMENDKKEKYSGATLKLIEVMKGRI